MKKYEYAVLEEPSLSGLGKAINALAAEGYRVVNVGEFVRDPDFAAFRDFWAVLERVIEQ